MTIKIQNRVALGSTADLTTPTSTQQYTLGEVVAFFDETTKEVKEYMYVKSHTTLVAYTPYVVVNLGTAGSEWITSAPFTLASAQCLVCVPQVAFTSGYYGWVLIKGKTTGLLTGNATAIDNNALEVLNGGATFVSASTGIVQTVNTCAFLVTGTTGVSGTIKLTGLRTEVAAS